MGLSSSTIADAILHDHIPPRRWSLTRVDPSLGVKSSPGIPSRVTRLIIPPSLVPERSSRIIPPATGASVVPFRALVACPGGPCHLGGLLDSESSSDSDFPFVW